MNLKDYAPIMSALMQASKENTVIHGNGTTGKEYYIHYWGKEEQVDSKRSEVAKKMARAFLTGDKLGWEEAKKEDDALPKEAKYTLIFRLMEKIPHLKGTKISFGDNNKTYTPEMNDVEFIHIAQDTIEFGLLDVEETSDKAKDQVGNEVSILKMKLLDGLLDVKEGTLDYFGKVTKPNKAWIYPISARSMQIVGKIMASERNRVRSRFGMTENI